MKILPSDERLRWLSNAVWLILQFPTFFPLRLSLAIYISFSPSPSYSLCFSFYLSIAPFSDRFNLLFIYKSEKYSISVMFTLICSKWLFDSILLTFFLSNHRMSTFDFCAANHIFTIWIFFSTNKQKTRENGNLQLELIHLNIEKTIVLLKKPYSIPSILNSR